MAWETTTLFSSPCPEAAAAKTVEPELGRQPNLGSGEARGEGVRSRCAPSHWLLLPCNIGVGLSACLSRSNATEAESGLSAATSDKTT
jgi:hypothetical protein